MQYLCYVCDKKDPCILYFKDDSNVPILCPIDRLCIPIWQTPTDTIDNVCTKIVEYIQSNCYSYTSGWHLRQIDLDRINNGDI